MKLKVLVGALVFLIVVNIAAIAAFLVVQTHRPHPRPEWREGRHTERPIDNLDRDKRRALLATIKQFHEESRDLIEQTRAMEDEAIAAMGENPIPRARIDSLLQQISDNRLEIARRVTDRMIAMGESLSPEERKHVMAALMRMRGRRDAPRFHRDEDSQHEE
jgi:uncharacterized membrane protein